MLMLMWRDEFTLGYLDFPWVDPGDVRPQSNRWIYDLTWGIGKFVQNLRNAQHLIPVSNLIVVNS